MEKCAVVTGASKGIGLEIARKLSEEGYQVFGLSRTEGPLREITWISCDVTDSRSVSDGFAEVLQAAGRIDVLVANAGMGISGAAEFAPEADYRRQFEVNDFGAVACAQKAAAVMRRQGGGRILFISSLAAIFPLPFQSFYSASKAALNGFSDALGIELKPFGVQTCAIMLNDVRTEFTDNRVKTADGDDVYGGRIKASVSKMEKSERNGMTPRQVANVAWSLLQRKKMPSHKIVGISNEFLGLLYRLLPTDTMLWLLGKIYG